MHVTLCSNPFLAASTREQASLTLCRRHEHRADLATEEKRFERCFFDFHGEATDFAAQEKEFSGEIDESSRVIRLVKDEVQKGGASSMLLKGAEMIAEAMEAWFTHLKAVLPAPRS